MNQVQHNRFLTFQSAQGSVSDQVTLPLSSLFLHTCYFRVHTGFQLTQEDKAFAAIVWEVFNILKENFPSKIYLSQENLDLCRPNFIPLSSSEELRRQISCLMSIKDEDRYLTFDEMEDAWHTLQFCEKVNDQRSLNICLELINSQINNWQQGRQVIEPDTLQRIANKNDYTALTSNKLIALEILEKINQKQGAVELGDTLQRQGGYDTQLNNDETISLASDNLINETYTQLNQYEKPTSTRMCLFQLSESNDINRVTMILETLSVKSKETLTQLRKKFNLSTKLLNILKKYCNAEYGFDQLSSRQGSFQSNLLKLFIILSQDYVVFLELLQSQTLDYLSQIIEEGIIYGYEDALSGNQSQTNTYSNATQSSKQIVSDLQKFLLTSLDFIELAISKQFQEFLPSIRENLRKIQSRMIKLVQKKDNALLNHFIQNYTSQQTIQSQVDYKSSHSNINIQDQQVDYNDSQISQSSLSIDQLTELKALSDTLYLFAVELNNKVQKIEALVDLQEEHEEKYSRLFYKIFQKLQRQKSEHNETNLKKIDNQHALKDHNRIQQHQTKHTSNHVGKVKFDLQQNNHTSLGSYPSIQQFDNDSINISQNQNDSFYTRDEIQKDNVFMRNQLEPYDPHVSTNQTGQSYKRVSLHSKNLNPPTSQQQLPHKYRHNDNSSKISESFNKENNQPAYFIGESPIRQAEPMKRIPDRSSNYKQGAILKGEQTVGGYNNYRN